MARRGEAESVARCCRTAAGGLDAESHAVLFFHGFDQFFGGAGGDVVLAQVDLLEHLVDFEQLEEVRQTAVVELVDAQVERLDGLVLGERLCEARVP